MSPDQNHQAEGRTHRIGQKNHPIYKDLIMQNTVDERILKIIKNKKNMLKSFQEMSITDIFKLI